MFLSLCQVDLKVTAARGTRKNDPEKPRHPGGVDLKIETGPHLCHGGQRDQRHVRDRRRLEPEQSEVCGHVGHGQDHSYGHGCHQGLVVPDEVRTVERQQRHEEKQRQGHEERQRELMKTHHERNGEAGEEDVELGGLFQNTEKEVKRQHDEEHAEHGQVAPGQHVRIGWHQHKHEAHGNCYPRAAYALGEKVEGDAHGHRNEDAEYLDACQIAEDQGEWFQYETDERRTVQSHARDIVAEESVHGAQVVGYVIAHVDVLRYDAVSDDEKDGQGSKEGCEGKAGSVPGDSAEGRNGTGSYLLESVSRFNARVHGPW